MRGKKESERRLDCPFRLMIGHKPGTRREVIHGQDGPTKGEQCQDEVNISADLITITTSKKMKGTIMKY